MTDQQHDNSDKAWSGRFSEPVSELVKRYTASVFFDKRMATQDIRGSLAHARMLGKQGIITAADVAAIESGMTQILSEIERNEFRWNLDDEDVHLNIEKRLTALIGDAGRWRPTFVSGCATRLTFSMRCCATIRLRCLMLPKITRRRRCLVSRIFKLLSR